MSVLDSVLGHESPWVAEKARILRGMELAHTSGDLSTEEYVELLEDLKSADDLVDNNDTIENKALLLTAITGLLKLI